MPSSSTPPPLTIGVLALQGAFHEHINHLSRISGVSAIPVRTPEQLALCSALVIPGGESTAIALGAQRAGLLEPLRSWVREGKPAWGTCAGMIMLAREATGGKKQQELIGGWDGRVSRNGWGSQVDSFETPLDIPGLEPGSSSSSSREPEPFPGVFIRAPVVERILPSEDIAAATPGQPAAAGTRAGEELDGVELVRASASAGADAPALPLPNPATYTPAESASAPLPQNALRLAVAPPLAAKGPRPPVQVVARLPADVRPQHVPSPGPDADVVALRQGNVFVTSFHPELTRDRRLHEWWVRECVRKA